jgi:hypothetical protein
MSSRPMRACADEEDENDGPFSAPALGSLFKGNRQGFPSQARMARINCAEAGWLRPVLPVALPL